MINKRFKIFLRRRQNIYANPDTGLTYNVTVQCNPATGYAEYIPGDVDNIWYDYTDQIDVDGVLKTGLTWDKANSGDTSATNQDGSNYDKGITSDWVFFDSAYQFIYDWLMTTECQILNAVEVKIVDLVAGGTYRIFEIKNDNIEFAPVDEPCQLKIKLREQDGVWHCVHKNTIWDDWQQWFKSGGKAHPCFLTCIEPRPRLIQSARMALLLFFHSNPGILFIDFLDQYHIKDDVRRILNANRFVDSPLVQTYVNNIAFKCGLLTDTIFDSGQPFQNLCVFYPQAGYMWESNSDAVSSPSTAYHWENRWMVTLADLLDKLKVVFAAEWYVTPGNTIVFKHTKDLIQLASIYDFTAVGAQPIYELRYTFDGTKKAAYGRYQYATDGSDLASQEIATLYNDIVDYDGPANNPMLEGDVSKTFEFASTGFVRDGRNKDYIELLLKDGRDGALALIGILAAMAVFLLPTVLFSALGLIFLALMAAWAIALGTKYNDLKNYFVDSDTYTGAVRMTAEQVLTPRLLLWDGANIRRAKVVKTQSPSPNPYYNTAGDAYEVVNDISQDNPSGWIYNYPMYFDSQFEGNLFDQYHDTIDNPLKSKESHQNVSFYVDLCEDMLKLFGVFESQYVIIGRVVKVEHRDNYDIYARISNIAVDYDQNRITIKGKVLRRT